MVSFLAATRATHIVAQPVTQLIGGLMQAIHVGSGTYIGAEGAE
jgi:hypothetical protein